MTENKKKESEETIESSDSTILVSDNGKDASLNNQKNPDTSQTVAEKAEEPTAGEETHDVSAAPAAVSDPYDSEKSSQTSSSYCCSTHDDVKEPQKQVPMFIGLSILFILLLFYYGLAKSKEQAEKISRIDTSVSAIGSQIGGLDKQISGFENSLTKYEQSILGLELKRSLVTVEEVISRSNEKTLNAAIRAKVALRQLIDSITSSSAGSKYRVKQISSVKERETPKLSVIKKESDSQTEEGS